MSAASRATAAARPDRLQEAAISEAGAPLSVAQESLWFLDRLAGSRGYLLPRAWWLRGRLDHRLLAAALASVERRHETLRTRFVEAEAGPRARLVPARRHPLAVVDLRALPAARRQPAARGAARDLVGRRFDLARGALARYALAVTGPGEVLFAVAVHHMVTDGLSMTRFARETEAAYRAALAGARAPLPPLALRYADYVSWQRRRLDEPEMLRHVGYWRQRLDGCPPSIELPLDRPRNGVQRPAAGSVALGPDPRLQARLARVAASCGTTPFRTLLAAFATLLSRYSGQRDLALGVPVGGRSMPGCEPLIGFFANTVAVRFELADDLPFAELAACTGRRVGEARAHPVPFERLVEELRPERSVDRLPLVQVAVAAQPPDSYELRLPGVDVETVEIPLPGATFDLTLRVRGGERAFWFLDFRRELFDTTTARRLLDQLGRVIKSAAEAPATPLARLSLLAPGERHQLLHEWSGSEAAVSSPPLHRRLADEARRRPEAVAASGGGECLTYAELDERSSALARRLIELGVGPEVGVGLCLPRAPSFLVAVFGAFKAGGFHVPLDPALPPERLAELLSAAGVRVVVTAGTAAAALPEHRLPKIDLDRDVSPAGPPPPDRTAPENLAYVLFTSGSTGRPKGVAVEHRQLAAYSAGFVRRLGLGPGLRFAVGSSYATDLAHGVLMPAIVAGGEMHCVDEELLLDPEGLGAAFDALGIDVFKLVPSHLEALLGGSRPASIPPRHTLVLGGETLTEALVRRVAALSACRLINHYGPTETTIGVTAQRADPASAARGSVPLGRPLPGARVLVLDRGLQPVPVGGTGEVFLGGSGLSRGYLGRPGATAERFVPDPFGTGGRLYRTGDLARRRAGGGVEFRGRADRQVKVRGFRVEPGEVERRLEDHPDVVSAAVVPVPAGSGDTRLVAYHVSRRTPGPRGDELAAFLRRTLPDALVPSVYVRLASFPRLASGKIDRGALPAPAPEAVAPAGAPPRSPEEIALAALWCELLAIDRLGVDDDFFRAGGHSLAAMRLVSAVRRRFGVALPLAEVFESPTLAAMAARIAAARGLRDSIPRLSRDQPLPLSFLQEAIWLAETLHPERPAVQSKLLELQGELEPALLVAAVGRVLERHEVLRTSVVEVDGAPVQRVLPATAVRLAEVDLRLCPAPRRRVEVERWWRREILRRFDLAAGRVLRLALLRTASSTATLAVSVSHIASDGWSLDLLLAETAACYRAGAAGTAAVLPALAIQYADFAAWQRGQWSGRRRAAELIYWRRRLTGCRSLLGELADRPADGRPGAARPLRRQLPPDLATRVDGLARDLATSRFVVLWTALLILLRWRTGARRIALTTPLAGRGRPDVDPLIGCFASTAPLAVGLGGDPSGVVLAGRAARALASVLRRPVPLEAVEPELDPESLAVASEVQISLWRFQGLRDALPGATLAPANLDARLELSGLEVSAVPAEDSLALLFVYNPRRFLTATVERLAEHYQRVLELLAAEPTARLSELSRALDRDEEVGRARDREQAGARRAAPIGRSARREGRLRRAG